MWCCLRSQNFSSDKIFNVDNVLIIYFGRYKYLAVHVKYIILLSTILFKIYKTFRKLLLPPSKMQRIRVKPWPLLINPNTFEPTQHCSWVKSRMLRMMAKTWPLLVYTKNLKPAQDCSWVKGKMLRMRARTWSLLVKTKNFETAKHRSCVKGKSLRMRTKGWSLLVNPKSFGTAQHCR